MVAFPVVVPCWLVALEELCGVTGVVELLEFTIGVVLLEELLPLGLPLLLEDAVVALLFGVTVLLYAGSTLADDVAVVALDPATVVLLVAVFALLLPVLVLLVALLALLVVSEPVCEPVSESLEAISSEPVSNAEEELSPLISVEVPSGL